MKRAILASLDSPWSNKEGIEYAFLLLKTALIFFDEVYVDDSEIIDSNQMRYIFSKHFEFLGGLLNEGRVKFTKREESIQRILLEVINRTPPMLFGSLDFTANSNILHKRSAGSVSIEEVIMEFKGSDLREGLSLLVPYDEYLSLIEKITSNSRISRLDKNYFREHFAALTKRLGLEWNGDVSTRTDVYNGIFLVSTGEMYRTEVIRDGIKALADIVYILNKSYLVPDDEIFIAFDKRHYDSIERSLREIGTSTEQVLKNYQDKDIRIVKMRVYPVDIDDDVSFFVKNIVPDQILIQKKENFLDHLESLLVERQEFEKLGFLKFIRKREKYSRIIERKFPRFRSSMEVLMFALTIATIINLFHISRNLSLLTAASFIIGLIVSIDGILGFIEYSTSRRLDTSFYQRIIKWYEEHTKRIENSVS